MDLLNLVTLLGLIAVSAPLALLSVLGVSSLLDRPLSERVTDRLVQSTVILGLVASLGVLAYMLLSGARFVQINLGDWVAVPHFHYSITLVFDRLSVPFVILTFILCGTIGAFASRYMHREPGFNRFFVLYALFVFGMVVTSLAGTIETLFAGWELVGLSSALLVGFFHERPAPVRNGLWVWVVYRISDAGLILAAIVMHHMTGEGNFNQLCGAGDWPDEQTTITAEQALIVGGLLLIAAAGKSALVPFSGWLPRAMEGPTPSSAVFYGALSVHLGAFLLLRIAPVLEKSLVLSALVVLLGLCTAAYGSLVGRVQTDIKSALSFASLTQVGIIVAEIGFGLRYIALIHILGHACLRTLQFIRAPTFLQDQRQLVNACGGSLPRPLIDFDRILPPAMRTWLYRFALERGYLDVLLGGYVVRPFVRLFQWFNDLEHRWSSFLSGASSEEHRG